ncbi:MAG TPA: type VI secretion system tube protein Hcp [Gemmataceae bacterium]|jgi:type VI secretion system secreted protein Hcp
MAQVDYFLKLDGIDGESNDDTFKKNIELESWSWGESNSGGFAHGSGGGAGKVAMQDFHFVMLMNNASASLAQACANGTHIASAELSCRKAGDTPQVFLKIKMSDVLVSSYQTGGSSHGEIVPTDQISINFAKIEYAYGKQDAKGKVASLDQKMGYDLKLNKKV